MWQPFLPSLSNLTVEWEDLNKERGSVWVGRGGGSSVAMPFWGALKGSKASETIDI